MNGIWLAHKELYQLTSEVIIKKRFELIPELEVLLKNEKNLFLNILKNPVIIIFRIITNKTLLINLLFLISIF